MSTRRTTDDSDSDSTNDKEGAPASGPNTAETDKCERGELELEDDPDDPTEEPLHIGLQPEREQQYDDAHAAILQLIADCSRNNWDDETKWILSIALAAICASRDMEERSNANIDDAFSAIADAIVMGDTLQMAPVHRIAREIIVSVMACGYHDAKAGFTEQLIQEDFDDDEERQDEAARVKHLSEALALLRGFSDLSRKQAILLSELYI